MVASAGIDAYLVRHVDGYAYKEHTLPQTSPRYVAGANETYVEAINNERFAVVIKVPSTFTSKSQPHYRVECKFDGVAQSIFFSNAQNPHGVHTCIQELQEISVVESSQTGAEDANFSFAPVEIDESVPPDGKSVFDASDDYGKVVVTVTPGTAIYFRDVERVNGSIRRAASKLSKEVATKNLISHVTRLDALKQGGTALGTMNVVRCPDYYWKKAPGTQGMPIVLTIKFCSRSEHFQESHISMVVSQADCNRHTGGPENIRSGEKSCESTQIPAVPDSCFTFGGNTLTSDTASVQSVLPQALETPKRGPSEHSSVEGCKQRKRARLLLEQDRLELQLEKLEHKEKVQMEKLEHKETMQLQKMEHKERIINLREKFLALLRR